MAKLRRLKPGRKEIIASLVIFGGVAVLLAFSSISGFFLAGHQSSSNLQAGVVSSGPYSLFGSSNVQNSASVSQNRVVNTSESLVGELKHGHFENVTGDIVSNLTSIGGYVASSNLMYNGTTWFGIYSVNVPSADSTQFLFDVTNLVNANGKTQSVQIQTQDVTNETGGNQSKVPYALFSITLQEEANELPVSTNPLSGLFGSIGSILGVVLGDVAYIVLIAVPIYFLVLGGVLLTGRVLYPMFLRVSKSSSSKQPNEVPSSVP